MYKLFKPFGIWQLCITFLCNYQIVINIKFKWNGCPHPPGYGTGRVGLFISISSSHIQRYNNWFTYISSLIKLNFIKIVTEFKNSFHTFGIKKMSKKIVIIKRQFHFNYSDFR